MSTIDQRSYQNPRNVNLNGQGSTRGGILRFTGTNASNPVGGGTGDRGLYINSSGDLVYANGSSTTVLGSGGGGVASLDGAYDNGRSITVDAGEIALNDATTGAAHTFAINKTGAGSGNLIDIDVSAAHTGGIIDINYGTGVAATGITFNAATDARTGVDILFTDDSTGTHSNIQLNKSGSGASIAFEYVGSYNGSPAGRVFQVTFDANDVLDTEVMQIDTGAGNRGIMFDYNFGHADAGTTSHIWDIDLTGILDSDVFNYATTAACTGNVFFLDLDNGVAQTALHIEGSGTRTQPFVELFSDCIGSASYVDINITGAGSGKVIDIVASTTSTGDILYVDMDAAVGAKFINLDFGAGTRTVDAITVTADGDGNKGLLLVTESNTGSGHLVDVNVTGIGSGNVLDVTYSAADTGDALKVVMADNVAGGALVITGAGSRTDSLIDVVSAETGSMNGIALFSTSGVFTGNIVTIASAGLATTGALLNLDCDAGVAYRAILIDAGNGARTVTLGTVTLDGTFGSGGGGTFLDINVTMTGASASPLFDIDLTGAYTGNLFDVLIGASLATGDVISIDLGATATGSQAMVVASGAMTRTTALFQISDAGTPSGAMFDINHTGASTGIWFDLDATAATTGNVFDFATSAASTGTLLEINMTNAVAAKLENYTSAGTRTVNLNTITDSSAGAVDVYQIDDSGTKSGHVWDVNVSGNSTGNVLDIVMSSSRVQGHAVHVDMGTDLAGNALLIDAAGVRTAPLIYIANTGTDGGTDDHVLFVNQTGLLDSNLIQLTYATAASTGEAISISMATNVDGRAIYVSSAGTGVTGEGNVLDIAHTGALVAGADVVSIDATGSISSTSNVLSVTQRTGAGGAGAYAVYISATGANVEALKVDDGTVTFDETLTVTGAVTFSSTLAVTGAATLSSTLSYRHLTEVVTATNVITASESGSVFFLNSATEFVSTLPAVAAGLHFTFIVSAAPSGASYTIVTASSANIIIGKQNSVAGDAGDTGTTDDTITFVDGQSVVGDKVEVFCDGTNWFAYAISAVAAGVTFTTAS